MDLQKILSQLRAELENLNAAIKSLERLPQNRRRGRPPAWLKGLGAQKKPRQRKPPGGGGKAGRHP